MKTYAPKSLRGEDLKQLMRELYASTADIAKFLQVTERSVLRWLAGNCAPRAVLCALWHETPHGREVCSHDVGNELVLTRATARIKGDEVAQAQAQLARLLAISDTGAANDPLRSGPFALSRVRVFPLRLNPIAQGWNIPHYGSGNQSATQHNYAFANQLIPTWKHRM
jgi:hypothetical protein